MNDPTQTAPEGATPRTNPDATDRPPAIRVRGVRKAYTLGPRRVEALRGVDLEIAGPGFFGVMGASGSGKTTLLHLLAGLDRPDDGDIHIAGRPISTLDETGLTAFRRRDIGIIFQQFNLIPTLSASENVALPGVLDGMSESRAGGRAKELLETLGLGERAGHRPDAMSGGEQQRVAIARALFFEPDVVFADEPTGNLDSTTSAQVWALLQRVAADHAITVVMVTHEPDAATHCERVFVLRDGQITGDFPTEGIDAIELASRAQQLGR